MHAKLGGYSINDIAVIGHGSLSAFSCHFSEAVSDGLGERTARAISGAASGGALERPWNEGPRAARSWAEARKVRAQRRRLAAIC